MINTSRTFLIGYPTTGLLDPKVGSFNWFAVNIGYNNFHGEEVFRLAVRSLHINTNVTRRRVQ